MRDCVAQLVYRLPKPVQPFLAIGGGILIHLTLGTIYSFGNVLPYIASYMKHFTNPNISPESFTWVLIGQGGLPFGMVVGGYLEGRIGPRFTALLGCAIMSTGVFLSYFTIKMSFLWLFLTFGLMFGTGQSIAYNAALICAMKWLPRRAGLASGLIVAGFGCGAFVFSPVQTEFVNPHNYELNCQLVQGKYSLFCQKDLLERVPYMFLLLGVCYLTMQILGSIFLINPQPVCPAFISTHKRIIQIFPYDDEVSLVSASEKPSVGVPLILKSTTFWWLFLSFFFNGQLVFFVSALYKRFGETFIADDRFLAAVGSAASICNAAGRVFWGWLADRFSFQVAMATQCTLSAALMLTLPSTRLGGQWMFLAWICAIFWCLSANFCLFPMATARCFGAKQVGVNYGFVILGVTTAGITSALLTEILFQKIRFMGMFFIVAAASYCTFILTTTIQMTKYGKGIESVRDVPDEDLLNDASTEYQ